MHPLLNGGEFPPRGERGTPVRPMRGPALVPVGKGGQVLGLPHPVLLAFAPPRLPGQVSPVSCFFPQCLGCRASRSARGGPAWGLGPLSRLDVSMSLLNPLDLPFRESPRAYAHWSSGLSLATAPVLALACLA